MTSVHSLSVALARVALEADRLLLQLEGESLTAADGLLLSGPVVHLRIVVDGVEQMLHEVSHFGKNRRRVAVEPDRLAA
jgi:hypothetical protein